ncbi:MAG: hypothetical protein ACPL1Y_04640 [Thermoplasmata archaeon]
MFQISGEEEVDYGLLCIYIIVMFAIVIVLYVILYVYTHFVRKGSRKHYCTYCGRLVDVESRCCHAPVEEYIFKKTCSKCKKDAVVVCKKCKKIILD